MPELTLTYLKTVHCEPMGAVRQNRADRWRKRPVVERYHAYRDAVRLQVKAREVASWGDSIGLVFHMPMPRSWSGKRRGEMCGRPCRQRPDTDNLLKGFIDAVFDEDKGIWVMYGEKRWAREGRIDVYRVEVSDAGE